MWPNVLSMFGIGKPKGINQTQSALGQGGQFDTELGTASSNVTGSQPAQQGPREKINYENLLKSDGQPLQMRNVEPALDPITGKPEAFRGNVPMAEAPQTPNTAGTEKSNSIWGKLKDFGEGYQKRMEEDGLIHPAFQKQQKPDKPWSVNDVADEQWHNKKMGIMFDPNDPNIKQKMIDASMGDDGNLDAERYQQISRYQSDVTDNPYYQQQSDKYYDSRKMGGENPHLGGPIGGWIERMFNMGKDDIKIPEGQ